MLRKNGVLTPHTTCDSKMATTSLSSFVASLRGLLQEESGLPRVRTNDVFNLNAYNLMKKSDYDLSKPPC